MSQPNISSLHDALLDRILQHLVDSQGTKIALMTACLINKRFAALIKQPLAAWGCTTTHVYVEETLVSDALANLTQWLVGVAPALRHLELSVDVDELEVVPPCHLVDVIPFLPHMTQLQVTAMLRAERSVLFTATWLQRRPCKRFPSCPRALQPTALKPQSSNMPKVRAVDYVISPLLPRVAGLGADRLSPTGI